MAELPALPSFPPAQPYTVNALGQIIFNQPPILPGGTTLPIGSITGLGAGIAAALAVNVGTAGAPVINGGVLGTPSSGVLINATGLPVATGIAGLAAGIATFLATPSSANLRGALTDPTGTGVAVFATSPSIATPSITGMGRTQSQPANPAASSSNSLIMAGLAGTITPAGSGNVLFLITGDALNNTANDLVNVQLRTGTGVAPINGAAATGTARSTVKAITSATASARGCWTVAAYVAGLALGTALWIDIAFDIVVGGTATLENIDIIAVEL